MTKHSGMNKNSDTNIIVKSSSSNHSLEVLNSLLTQKETGQFCDIKFYHGSSHVFAHSCILATYSPFMMRLFMKLTKQKVTWSSFQPMLVNISNISKCNESSSNNCMRCITKVINYLYSGVIHLDNDDHFSHIVNISSNLEIDNLLKLCQQFLEKKSYLQSVYSDNQMNYSKNKDDNHQPALYEKPSTFKDTEPTGQHSTNQKNDCFPLKKLKNAVKVGVNNEVNKSGKLSTEKPKQSFCTSCKYCTDDDLKFRNHKTIFHNKNYICLECNFTCINISAIVDHLLKSSHGGKICSICFQETDSIVNLRKHLQVHLLKFPFQCTLCGKKFKYRFNYARHQYSCNTTQQVESSQLSFRNSSVCSICNYEVGSKEKLEQHKKILHQRMYECLNCQYSTIKLDKMIEHLLEVRHEQTVCSICLQESENNDALLDHITCHQHIFPFSCANCDMRFSNRSSWMKHLMLHRSKKAFKCKLCDKCFLSSNYLQNHMYYKHAKKKYVCTECGFTARFANRLAKHFAIHKKSRYCCTLSNCKFTSNKKREYDNHLITHIEEIKIFECIECNVRYRFKKNLHRHFNSFNHSSGFIIHCPICDFSDTSCEQIKKHFKEAHKEEKNMFEQILKHCGKNNHKIMSSLTNNKTSTSQNINQQNLSFDTNVENNSDKVNDIKNKQNAQTVVLSESTGKISIINENEGMTIPVASVTSTNMLTIENYRENTGSMTLNEATGLLTLSNINVDSTGAVFLNESTGELSYINLNVEQTNVEMPSQNKTVGDDTEGNHVELNEVTGEIITIEEKQVINKQSEKDLNDFFDYIEESCDGLFPDTLPSPFDPDMDDILTSGDNYFDDCVQIPRLDEMTGELTFPDLLKSKDQWTASLSEKTSDENEDNESLLNEVTGEYRKISYSIL